MRYLLSVLLLAFCLQAQVTVTLTGPASVTAGGTANLTVSIAGTTQAGVNQNIVGVQWSMTIPATATIGTCTVPTNLSAENYQAFCGPAASLAAEIIASGTFTPLADGAVANVPLTFATTQTPGTLAIPLTGLYAVNSSGTNVNGVVSGPVYSLKILSICDLNGDGIVNVADVMLAINGLIGTTTCPLSAVAGGCTLANVVNEIIAVTGGTCKIP